MATAINDSIRETGAESYLDDDEGALEFVASDRVCESRPPLVRRRKLRRSVTKATVLLAPSRFSTSQPYTSSSLTRSTRQWHSNSDDSRTARDDDTKRPFSVVGRRSAVWNSFLPAQFPSRPFLSSSPAHLPRCRFSYRPPRRRHMSSPWTMTAKVNYAKIALQVCEANRNWLALRIGISRFRRIYQLFVLFDLSDNLLHYSGTN